MARYENPHNGFVETIGAGSVWGTLFLGSLWFFIKGSAGVGFAYLVWSLFLWFMIVPSIGVTFILWVALHLVFAFMAPGLIGGKLQRMGWRRLPD